MEGMTVQLIVKTQIDTDPFGAPIYSEEQVDIDDVLVGSPSTSDYLSVIELTGKRISYVLGIPKTDTHDWTDAEVIIWGERYKAVGLPQTGIQENIPLRWRANVMVERYE